MAGEFMVVGNPRRRKARRRTSRAKAKATTTRRRRRVRARAVHHNPTRRRRRVSSRRTSVRRRRVHRNPRIGISGLNTNAIVAGLAGAAVADIGAGFLAKHLPATWQSGAASYVVKAAVGVAVPMIGKKLRVIPGHVANAMAAGALLVVGFEAYLEYVKPHLPIGEYLPGNMGEYAADNSISGVAVPDPGVSMYGGSMY